MSEPESKRHIPGNDLALGGWCMVAYIYNTSASKFADDVYGEAHPDYLDEKAQIWALSPARAIAGLDPVHFRRLMGIAVSEHIDAAAMMLGLGCKRIGERKHDRDT